jgi:hypothetical protein
VQNVMDAARNMADDYPGGARALAARFDKNPVTFSHELNETGQAKLGLVDAIKACKRAKDRRVVNEFAKEMGCGVHMLPEMLEVDGDDAVHLVANMAKEFNDTVQAYVGAVSDNRMSGNELADIRRQGGELQVVLQRVIAHAEKLYEAAKPSGPRLVGASQE